MRFHILPIKPNSLTLPCVLVGLIALGLLSGTVAAQQSREKKQAEAVKLFKEGLVASVTNAIESLVVARVIARAVDNVATLRSFIGSSYQQGKQYQKAIENYEQSVLLFRALGDRKGEATSLVNLGFIHSNLGETQRGLDYANQAALLFHAVGDVKGEGQALVTIGSVHSHLGKHEEALIYFNKAVELFHAAGSHEEEILVLSALGTHYFLAGQSQKAWEKGKQALSASRAALFPQGEAFALVTLGSLYISLDSQKAIEYFEQALVLFQAARSSNTESVRLYGLCAIHLISSNYEDGFDYCAQALALLRGNRNRQNEARALKTLAIEERNRGNLAASQVAIEPAIEIIESLRTKVINPELRLSFFTTSQDDYEFYIDLLMLLHEQQPNEGFDGKALEASERAHARSLLDTLTEAKANIRQGVDAALLQRELEIQRRLNARAQTQMAVLRPYSETQATKIAEDIQILIKELQQVETEIRQTSPRYAALTQPRLLTLKEIQTQVLDRDTLLLEYSLGKAQGYLWAVTSSSITSHLLPERSEIERSAREFYNLLNARNVLPKGETNEEREKRIAEAEIEIPKAAASLGQMVLGPVAKQLGDKRLVIVADGALHFVPFGALPVVIDGASRPLVADHEIVNLPSASTLAVIREEIAGRQMAPRSVAVLADPVFMKTDERVKRNKNQEVPKVDKDVSKDRQLVKAAAEDTGLANEGLYIPRLPGTRQEAKQIMAMIPTVEGRLALDFVASRDTAMSAALGQYRYVHFATHGFLDSVHPELSGLVFSLVNERGDEQDGFLRAHDLFNLNLPVEVVVLSACQTGIGKNIKGEGLVSLTRGFMYAGAPRVVVSLWGVSDLGTTELMVHFYRRMLQDGMRPAAALRAAQLSLMNDPRWASQYYWAPFTLQGEWR
ncbi:MAG TPA: CHAT domain-containing protein [Pyrinomonadaceae bacterium]|nr:CHAT domain-containing protein [Pyrinomonadaceae bacterium]